MKSSKIIFLSTIFYLLLWSISPLEIRYEFSSAAVYLIALMLFSLLAGAISFELLSKKLKTPSFRCDQDSVYRIARRTFWFIFTLALIGLVLRFIDKVVVRDVLSYSSSVERRDADVGASIFGVISAPLYIFALALPAYFRFFNFGRLFKLVVWGVFFLPAVEVAFMGSRGLIVTTLAMLFVYLFFLRRLRLGGFLAFCVLGVVAFYISGVIFIQRISSYGYSPLDSAFTSVYAFTLVPNAFASNLIDSGGPFSFLIFLLVNGSQYVLHGFLEFSYLFDHFEGYDYQWGSYTFRVFSKLFGVDIVESAQMLTPRSGVYTTLLGPLWVDFGFFSFLFIYLWGWFMAVAYRRFKFGQYQYLPLYGYMVAVAFFAPVVNLIQNALGVYLFIACLGSILIFWFNSVIARLNR